MTAIIRQVAEALGERLRVELGTLIAKPPTVITEPPSAESVESGALAIMFERYKLELGQESQVDANADGDGPAVGGDYATPEDGATLYEHGDGVQLTTRGTLVIQGRIWCGARLAPKREVIEEEVISLFFEEEGSQGRMDVVLPAPTVRGVKIPWDWTFSVLTRDDVEWQGEMSFAERLWSFVDVSVEVSILMARRSPLVRTMLVALTQDLDTPVTTPAEADEIIREEYVVEPDDTLTLRP